MPASPDAGSLFQRELDQVTAPLQRALEAVLAQASGGSASATELARTLGIETTLAWRIWRLVHSRTTGETVGFIVGTSAMEKLLAACANAGADDTLLAAVRDTHRSYRAFVKRCAGNEATLKNMLASGALGSGEAEDVNRRMFEANRLRVGVQAAAQLRCCVMYPGSIEGIGSAAVVDMFNGLWWWRPNAKAVVRVRRLFHTHESADQGAPVLHLATPLDPDLEEDSTPDNPPLLPYISDFCDGDGTLIEGEQIGGSTFYTIRPRSVGQQCKSTLCFGEIQHDCILPLNEDPQMIFSTATMAPAELMVLEVYVHKSQVGEGFAYRPWITDALFRPLETALWAPRVEEASIGGTYEVIEPTEMIDSPIHSANYRPLINYVFERIRMQRGEFYCFRLRLPLPPLGLMVSLLAGEDLDGPPSE